MRKRLELVGSWDFDIVIGVFCCIVPIVALVEHAKIYWDSFSFGWF